MQNIKRYKTVWSFVYNCLFTTITVVLSLGLVFYFSANVFANSNDYINFQGKIVNADGTSINNGSPSCVQIGTDTCDFKILYYDASVNGNLLGAEEFLDTEIGDTGGVYNLKLGNGLYTSGVESSVQNIFLNNSSVYIEIGFDPNGGANYTEIFTTSAGDRMPVNSVPYSVKAKTSSSIEGGLDTVYTNDNDKVLNINTSNGLFFAQDFSIGMGGWGGTTSLYTTDSGVYFDPAGLDSNLSGNGIVVLADYTGSTLGSGYSEYVSIDSANANPYSGIPSRRASVIAYENDGADNVVLKLLSDNSSGTGASTIILDSDNVIQFNTGGSERVRITDTGLVGIGNSSPSSLLSVGASEGFKVDSTGNITSINGVSYSFPSSQGASSTCLVNDGSGNLSWSTSCGGSTSGSLYTNSGIIANGSYLEVIHNQGTNDLAISAWVNDGNSWKEISSASKSGINVNDDTLVAWYDAEELSGDLTNQEGSVGNDLTVNNSPLYQQVGKIGNAITLDGIDDFFSTNGDNDNFDFGSDSFTIGGWFKHDAISTNPDYLIAKYSDQPAIDVGNGADGDVTVSTNTNINTDTLIAGRSCADGGDAVNYSVIGLTSSTATLSVAPSSGCLNVGDEVLLINLQGSSASYDNVGNYETLRVASVSGSTVTFTTAKTKFYGANPTDDSNIGINAGEQHVMLQRVPNYGNVTVDSGSVFSPSAWDGLKGGVMFFKASGAVNISGSISASNTGYRGGIQSSNIAYGGEAFCSSYAGGNGGDQFSAIEPTDGICGGGGGAYYNGSYIGVGSALLGGAGGGGGFAYDNGDGNFGAYAGAGGGGGHWTPGDGGMGGYIGNAYNGVAGGVNSSGDGGGIDTSSASEYTGGGGGGGGSWISDINKITFGAGGGAGGTSKNGTSWQTGAPGGRGGGIVSITSSSITIGSGGSIVAKGEDSTIAGTSIANSGGGAGAGGDIRLNAYSVDIGTSLVNANGGVRVDTVGYNDGGAGGNGSVHIKYVTTLNGSSVPAFTSDIVSNESGGYKLYMNPDGTISFGIDDDYTSFPEDVATTSASYDDGKWHHIVAVKDGTSSIKIFVDGQEVASDYNIAATGSLSSSATLYLGIDSDGASNSWAGSLDQVVVYNRALSPGEIQQLYKSDQDFFIEQPDNNSVRLYNNSGKSQELRMVIATAGLGSAELWTTDPNSTSVIRPANNKGLRIYDSAGTNYLELSHDGTLATLNNSGGGGISIDTNGRVLIGTTITSTKDLMVEGTVLFGKTSGTIAQIANTTLLSGEAGLDILTQDTSATDEYFLAMRLVDASWNTTDNKFLFNTNGDALADGSWTGGGADIAELYPVVDSVHSGDIVAISGEYAEGNVPMLSKATKDTSFVQVLGVVSTDPGLVMGNNFKLYNEDLNVKPIALTGRVPLKVSLENGIIHAGDPLTLSSQAGVAMKANVGDLIIGVALEDYDGVQQISEGVKLVENDLYRRKNELVNNNLSDGVGKILAFIQKQEPERRKFESQWIYLKPHTDVKVNHDLDVIPTLIEVMRASDVNGKNTTNRGIGTDYYWESLTTNSIKVINTTDRGFYVKVVLEF